MAYNFLGWNEDSDSSLIALRFIVSLGILVRDSFTTVRRQLWQAVVSSNIPFSIYHSATK